MIEFVGIGKRFGGVTALHDLTLSIAPGTCHALVGENGAGKSTLGRVLAGLHAPDAGELRLDGRARRFRSPADALAHGIAMVHQELSFCPALSVAENLALGRWPVRGVRIDRAAMHARAVRLLGQVGASIDVRRPMAELSTAQEQLCQIAAALGTGARTIVFDEPTGSLPEADAARLLALAGRLRDAGTTLLWVSHRLAEVFALADTISVLRDGRLVQSGPRAATSPDAVVAAMIGRPLRRAPAGAPGRPPGAVRLALSGCASPGRFADVSLAVRAGEIVGLAGLVGAGRSELLRAVFGLDRRATGRVEVDGRPLAPRSVRAALDARLALVPEDRKRQGLVTGLGARVNWSLPFAARFARRRTRRIDRPAEARAAAAALAAVGARADDLEAPVAQLSGGNQQKVVLARWFSTDAGVLLVDEPTRGVDVGAKAAIHALLVERAAAGAAILLASSDLEELLALSTRVLVLRAGRLVAELPGGARDEDVLRAMAGLNAAAAG